MFNKETEIMGLRKRIEKLKARGEQERQGLINKAKRQLKQLEKREK